MIFVRAEREAMSESARLLQVFLDDQLLFRDVNADPTFGPASTRAQAVFTWSYCGSGSVQSDRRPRTRGGLR